MTLVTDVSRRGFLRGVVGTGSLVLGVPLAAGAGFAATAAAADGRTASNDDDDWPAHLFVAVAPNGDVTVLAHRSEMGTGIRTALPMVVADELGADWNRVSIRQAVGDRKYGSQNTDGSRSIRRFMRPMQEAGASVRTMLEQAAAKEWSVDASECRADNHRVVHTKSDRSASFGDLVATAKTLPVPKTGDLRIKTKDEWRYIGKRGVRMTDATDIVTGKATFGLDATLDGAVIASIEHAPSRGARVKSVDDAAAKAVDGVLNVVQLAAPEGPTGFNPIGGVAVVAKDTFAALQGRRALKIEWATDDAHASYDSDAFRKELEKTVSEPGRVVRQTGDLEKGFESAAKIVEAEYYTPHLAHASMEPPCAVARFADGKCECWAPTQNPQAARTQVAASLGISEDAVTVHVTLLGGGFGRKSKPDYVAEAALLSREVGKPVKVVWTREDDIRHDYFHSVAAMKLKAGLDGDGKPVAMLQRTAFPSISSTFNPAAVTAGPFELDLGWTDMPFDVPNLQVEVGSAQAHVRIGWFRAVCNVWHAFALHGFMDELAAAAGRDRLEFLRDLLGEPRILDLSAQGVQYGNYGESIERYPIETGRLRKVLDVAAEAAGWGKELPKGRGLGLAVHRSFLCYVACAVEVEVTKDGQVKIPHVHMAADCGLAVHPERVESQMEGAAIFSSSLALFGEITAKDGQVQQSNFHDYRVARITEGPREVHVHLVDHDGPPGGVGEPGVPPFAPALCNAIFAATGKRIRSLPISKHDLSWG